MITHVPSSTRVVPPSSSRTMLCDYKLKPSSIQDIGKRLNLESLREELNCQNFYINGRISGPVELFDVFMPEDTDVVISSRPAEAHGLDDISLILYTSSTSSKKKSGAILPPNSTGGYLVHSALLGFKTSDIDYTRHLYL